MEGASFLLVSYCPSLVTTYVPEIHSFEKPNRVCDINRFLCQSPFDTVAVHFAVAQFRDENRIISAEIQFTAYLLLLFRDLWK